jgi:hypothetical protein
MTAGQDDDASLEGTTTELRVDLTEDGKAGFGGGDEDLQFP